ncbi:MAG: helix-turn-helix domain-containing protein [Gemmatimonadota bacterium]
MSNKAITWAYAQTGMKSGAKFVLVALADMADSANSCYPGVPELVSMTEMGASTVKKHLDVLIAGGWITRERRHRKDGSRTSNRYYLTMVTFQVDVPPDSDAGPEEDEPRAPEGTGDATSAPEIQEPDSGSWIPEANVSNLGGLSLDLSDPMSRIWGGILEPPVNPQIKDLKNSLSPADSEPSIEEWFERFWVAYPRHKNKKTAAAKFVIAARKTSPAVLVAAAIAFRDDPARNPDPQFNPYASTWLHQERWNDEPEPVVATPRKLTNVELNMLTFQKQYGGNDGPQADQRALESRIAHR